MRALVTAFVVLTLLTAYLAGSNFVDSVTEQKMREADAQPSAPT
jgi:hypothetical protein